MPDPLVSIIIPVFNAGKYIGETVQSALNQTWANKEIIVINNGSTDDTLAVLSNIKSHLITIITQDNKGAAGARNTGLRAAKGAYIQFLDADDLISPDKIESQLKSLDNSQSHLGICKTVQFFDGTDPLQKIADNNWYYKDHDDVVDFLTKLYTNEEIMPGYGGIAAVHNWLTPRAIIDKAGMWNENLSTDDDGEFFCRVILAADEIKFSGQGISYYRKYKHQQSLSGAKSKSSFQSRLLATDLKHQYLSARSHNPFVTKIFARLYWWLGVEAYPTYKDLSKQSIVKAKKLGFNGKKYVGGPKGVLLTKFLGWKLTRLLSHYKHS